MILASGICLKKDRSYPTIFYFKNMQGTDGISVAQRSKTVLWCILT